MALGDILTLARAAVRSIGDVASGRIGLPQDRLGHVLEMPDGGEFQVYRETVRRQTGADATDDGVVLVFRMHVTEPEARGLVRRALFDPLANVATPFYAGLPGFRRKLWLAGERPGEFLELYEWESEAEAERFVDVLETLIGPVDFAGSASFEVLPDDSVDEYVAARAAAWRDTGARLRGRGRHVGGLVVLAAAIGLSLLAWTVWSRLRRG